MNKKESLKKDENDPSHGKFEDYKADNDDNDQLDDAQQDVTNEI